MVEFGGARVRPRPRVGARERTDGASPTRPESAAIQGSADAHDSSANSARSWSFVCLCNTNAGESWSERGRRGCSLVWATLRCVLASYAPAGPGLTPVLASPVARGVVFALDANNNDGTR